MFWSVKSKLIPKWLCSTDLDKLSTKNQITFFTSIRNFLDNGFSLGEAIDFYTVVNPRQCNLIDKIKQSLASGKSFSESIKPLVNFRIFCQLKIAEFHGNLLDALNDISKFLTLKQRQRNKVINLLIYPIFLIILLIGILIAIRLLVTPQLHSINSNQRSNQITWALVALLPSLILIYGIWRYCHEQSRIWQINVLLRIPLLGNVCRAYFAYYFSSNLSLMMNCGMDLKQIVNFMGSFKTSSLIQTLSQDVRRVIDQGYEFNQLRDKYHFLPKELVLLLDNGDTNQILAQKLKAYSKIEFKLMMKRSSRIISMMQPMMFLIIGLFIAGTYLSMLLPMYQSIKGVY